VPQQPADALNRLGTPLNNRIKTMMNNPKAILLVGGRGTRLRSVVPSTPKPLASVGNRSFLELLVRQLRSQEIYQVVMCTGYLAEQIEDEFGDGHALDVSIEYSKEPYPLGTAGAVKLAARYLNDASAFVVMNGDSFLEIDFRQLIRFHHEKGGLISMAVSQVRDAARYGTVQVDARGRVIGFFEKMDQDSSGIINAGVYVFSRAVLEHISDTPSSLETDVLPHLLEQGVYALEQRGMFIDIGTPEDYARAQGLRDRLYEAAFLRQLSPLVGTRSISSTSGKPGE
jgi:NDP-sugar pyrophosphorylase family protein